jgi:hypothetical protein
MVAGTAEGVVGREHRVMAPWLRKNADRSDEPGSTLLGIDDGRDLSSLTCLWHSLQFACRDSSRTD